MKKTKGLEVEIPEKLGFLFDNARYKVAYGGRGAGKSHSVVRALLIQGMQRPLRILCAREFQRSIADSVHKLIADQIHSLGMDKFYTVQNASITGTNGTEFSFVGLKHNVANIKSIEGIDICWVEEAQTVSKTSWEVLIPTIRKEGSEIWVTFNPELEEDDTYKRFVLTPPSSAEVVKVNYHDNPWFPAVLEDERQELKTRDPDAYLHVWEGQCRTHLEGAVYAEELRRTAEENRITRVPYDASIPVSTIWDLGFGDLTTVIMVQSVGQEVRVIDYMSNRHKLISWYIAELQRKEYVWGTHWLPHDAAAGSLSGPTVERQMRDVFSDVRIVTKLSIIDGINAARTMFNRVWFDSEKTADLVQSLRHYRFDVNMDTGKYSDKPLHDEWSHGADAFRYLAIASENLRPMKVPTLKFRSEFRV